MLTVVIEHMYLPSSGVKGHVSWIVRKRFDRPKGVIFTEHTNGRYKNTPDSPYVAADGTMLLHCPVQIVAGGKPSVALAITDGTYPRYLTHALTAAFATKIIAESVKATDKHWPQPGDFLPVADDAAKLAAALDSALDADLSRLP